MPPLLASATAVPAPAPAPPLAARALPSLEGRTVARVVDYTDMPGEPLRVVAGKRVGPAEGWASLDDAHTAALALSAEEGPQNPAIGVFERGGRFEAYALDQTFANFTPRPLEFYWQDGDIGWVRTQAGESMRALVDNGNAIADPSTYAHLRRDLNRVS
jgi:hypothetical protein